jgi:uroporphyrin-III C-methyltransferase
VLFTTAHRKPSGVALDWTSAVTSDTTVVLYMPGAAYAELGDALVQGGLDPQTPCLVVSCASRQSPPVRWTDVASLRKLTAVPAPALLIIGRVARSQPKALVADLWNEFRAAKMQDEQCIA